MDGWLTTAHSWQVKESDSALVARLTEIGQEQELLNNISNVNNYNYG